jgi:hypothetical protein
MSSGTTWVEGDVVGDCPNELFLSFAEYRLSSESKVFVSATSQGHAFAYNTPANAGLGWGDFDAFNEWQSYGRMTKGDLLPPDQNWKTNACASVFVNEKTGEKTQMRLYKAPPTDMDDPTAPESLHTKMKQKQKRIRSKGVAPNTRGRSN